MFGWPSLVHFCDTCGHNTAVEYTGTVWIQEHTCCHVRRPYTGRPLPPIARLTCGLLQCGVKAKGADIVGESQQAMNSYQHDELANLFAQLSTQQQQQQHRAPTAVQLQNLGSARSVGDGHSMNPEKIDAPLTFASAHYTHSWHLNNETQSEPARSPPPPYHDTLMPEAMAETLRQHSIDPSALLPNQVELFVNADYEQRLRLLELWRISPPSHPVEKHVQRNSVPTSIVQEEADAKARYEQQHCFSHAVQQEEHMFDTFIPRPRAASIASGQGILAKGEAEPYMMNGYQQRSDPVFAGNALWQAPSYAQAQQQSSMEDQYGMYQQIRNHADWERLNQQSMQRVAGGDDDAMVM